MRIRLIAVGTRQPRWVEDGFAQYAGRMPRQCRIELLEIPTVRRGGSVPPPVAVEREGRALLEAIPARCHAVALDERGTRVDTAGLARHLASWLGDGDDVALLIGGPDGLSPSCLERADRRWSLSPLTLPHGLVRIMVAEQLYRAWSITTGHPYHRA